MTARKRARTGLDDDMAEAKAATARFLAGVRQAMQAPLASLPRRNTPACTAAAPAKSVRRSARLANQPLNSTVRASKKGEVLVLRKLGLLTNDTRQDGEFCQKELASIFTGPLDDHYFQALRDIIPAAQALSDADIINVAALASGGAISVC